jgi:nicotinamidase-related amidase
MPVWSDVVPESDRETYRAAGFGASQQPGTRPALLVVDVTYGFTGTEGQSLREAVREYRTSCGPYAWAAIPAIGELVGAARTTGVPVIYTRGRTVRQAAALGGWAAKNRRAAEDVAAGERRNTIVAQLAPGPDDLVIEKDKPSGFFGTALVAHLVDLGVDTLVVTGGTTSGCVRATVVDAFSYNFRVVVPQEAVFDRATVPHKVNLFDLHAKYAQIQPVEQTLAYLRQAQQGGLSR